MPLFELEAVGQTEDGFRTTSVTSAVIDRRVDRTRDGEVAGQRVAGFGTTDQNIGDSKTGLIGGDCTQPEALGRSNRIADFDLRRVGIAIPDVLRDGDIERAAPERGRNRRHVIRSVKHVAQHRQLNLCLIVETSVTLATDVELSAGGSADAMGSPRLKRAVLTKRERSPALNDRLRSADEQVTEHIAALEIYSTTEGRGGVHLSRLPLGCVSSSCQSERAEANRQKLIHCKDLPLLRTFSETRVSDTLLLYHILQKNQL